MAGDAADSNEVAILQLRLCGPLGCHCRSVLIAWGKPGHICSDLSSHGLDGLGEVLGDVGILVLIGMHDFLLFLFLFLFLFLPTF